MSSAGAAGRTPQDAPGSGAKGGRRRPVPADLLTIGEVLAELQDEFADVSHSKIRFLEDRGLVSPARTPSGYRKFSRSDVERLRLVLSLQRDHYLPLRVIGEHVAALDAGHAPPRLPGGGYGSGYGEDPADQAAVGPDGPLGRAPLAHPRPSDGAPGGPTDGEPAGQAAGARAADPHATGAPATGGAGLPVRPHRLSRAEVVSHAAGDAALVDALESHGLLARSVSGYSPAAADVVVAAKQLAGFGIEPRHLRALRTAADREAALVEQVVSPLRRPHGPTSPGAGERRDRAAEVTAELAATLLRLHGSLLRSALDGADG